MEYSLGGFADDPLASASADGHPTVGALDADEARQFAGSGSAEETPEAEDTEFWDACWTLEDEWMPRVVVRSEPRPRRAHVTQLPEVFVLL